MIKDYFVLAWRNIRKRKLRSWLTMIGIFVSIATIFTLVSLSLGLQWAVEEQFRLLGTDKFFIQPKTGFMGPPGSIGGVILTTEDVDTVIKVSGIKDYSYFIMGSGKIEFNDQIRYNMIWGMPPDQQDVWIETGSWETLYGRLLKKGDDNSIVIGIAYNEDNVFKKPVNVGDTFTINDQDFKVKGILKRIGNPEDDRSIMLTEEGYRDLVDEPDKVDYIMLQIEEGQDINEIAKKTEKKLRKARGLTEKTQDFMILTPEEILESFQNILLIITAFLLGVAAISLLVGAIGIANTMYTAVLERTKEIGVMKAVGAKNSDIRDIFLIESGLLGLVGAIIGVILGFAISKTIEYIAVNSLNTTLLQAAAPLYLIIGCLGFGFLIGAISGTLPALQASKLNVVDALRYE